MVPESPRIEPTGQMDLAVNLALDVELPVAGPIELAEVGVGAGGEGNVGSETIASFPCTAFQKDRRLRQPLPLHLVLGYQTPGEVNEFFDVGRHERGHALRGVDVNRVRPARMVQGR